MNANYCLDHKFLAAATSQGKAEVMVQLPLYAARSG